MVLADRTRWPVVQFSFLLISPRILGAQLLLIGSSAISVCIASHFPVCLSRRSYKVSFALRRLIGEEDEQEEILQIFFAYFLAFSSSGYGPAFERLGEKMIAISSKFQAVGNFR